MGILNPIFYIYNVQTGVMDEACLHEAGAGGRHSFCCPAGSNCGKIDRKIRGLRLILNSFERFTLLGQLTPPTDTNSTKVSLGH